MRVLLVHGMGRTALSMRKLARRLRGAGHEPESFGYVAALQGYGSIVDRLARRLEAIGAGGPYAVVGHSLGGVLLRSAEARVSRAPEATVMLGTPNQPSRIAARCCRLWPYRWLFRDCGANLASPAFYASLPPPRGRVVLVAGTRAILGGRRLFEGHPNDGLVAVSETRLRDDDPVVLVAATHTFLMSDARAQEAVLRALAAIPTASRVSGP